MGIAVGMSAAEAIGLLFSAAALTLATYSRYKQRKAEKRQQQLEKRIEQKEELREMADTLGYVVEWMNVFHTNLSQKSRYTNIPHAAMHGTLHGCLCNLCKDMLGYLHFTGEVPVLKVSVHYYANGGEEVSISDANEVVERHDNHETLVIAVSIDDNAEYGEENIFCHLDSAFEGASKFKFQQEGIRDAHEELINEFSPDLLDRIESIIDEIMTNCTHQALNCEPGIQLDPKEYNRIDDIAEDIIEIVLLYDGIEEDLQELEILFEEAESTRKSVLQTSYS